MKRFFRCLLFFLLISGYADPKELIFHGEYLPPFFCDLNSDSPGFAVELLKAVYPEKEYLLLFRTHAWQNAAFALKRKKISAYIGIAKADYPELSFPKFPIFRLRSAVYLQSGLDLKYRTPDSLAGLKTGFLVDYSHSDAFDRYQEQHEKDGTLRYYGKAKAAETMLKDLASGKIQAFVHYTAAIDWALLRVPDLREKVKCVSLLPNETDFYAAFVPGKKESQEYIRVFNRRFPEFKKSPEYRSLLRKYGLKETDLP